MNIRNGKMSYEELIRYAEDLMQKLDVVYEQSPLPHSADFHAIEALLMKIQKEYYGFA